MRKTQLLEENRDFARVRKAIKGARFFDVLHNTDLPSVRRDLVSLECRSTTAKELKGIYHEGYYLLNAVLACHETVISTDEDNIIRDPDLTYVPAIFAQGRSLTFGNVGLVVVNKKMIVFGVEL